MKPIKIIIELTSAVIIGFGLIIMIIGNILRGYSE